MRAFVYIAMVAASLLTWRVGPAWSQVAEAPPLDALWEAYQALDYARAEQLAQAALAAYQAPQDLAQVHVVLGLIAFSQNDQAEASRQFTDALVLDPSVQLDALLVSPKTLDFFDDIRNGLARATRDALLEDQPSPRYVLVPDPRAAAALRSMVLPGWGQLYKGQRTKGRVLLGVWGVAVAGTAAAHVLRQQARTTYLDAETPDEALEHYDTFNRWHKTRGAFALGVAAVWVYGYLDALIDGSSSTEPRKLRLTPTFFDRQMHLSMQVRF